VVKEISIDEYDYPLSEDRIAKYPLKQRDKAKLLYWDGKQIKDRVFADLPSLLSKDTLLIFNDTKVVYARLLFKKTTGSTIEIFCLEPLCPNSFQLSFSQNEKTTWKCLVGNNKKWKEGILSQTKQIDGKDVTLTAQRKEPINECWVIEFAWDKGFSFAEIMQEFGIIPLPPYLKRKSEEEDKIDYQTIYAHYDGSVAAPTAGLHFTDTTFKDLSAKNIRISFVTLHVGAGTFKPVTEKTIGEHQMHTERIIIPFSTIEDLLSYIDKEIICVGTTSVRTIESLYWYGVKLIESNQKDNNFSIEQWYPYKQHQDISIKESLESIRKWMLSNNLDYLNGQTELIIAPSYNYRIVKGMVTNFHQPKSTLLLLVSAMVGEKWKEIYQHALRNDYRFLSYGDACLFRKI